MGDHYGKQVREWLRTDEITSFLERLSQTEGIPSVRLVEQKEGRFGGTWLHPTVAMHYAYKLDNDVKLAMGRAFQEKLSGRAPDLLQPTPPSPLELCTGEAWTGEAWPVAAGRG